MNLCQHSRTLRFLAVYLPIDALVVGILILFTGLWPKTGIGWAILLMLWFPMWLFGEYIGSKLFGDRIIKRIDSSDRKLSLLRMGYAVFVMVMFLAFMAGMHHFFKGFWQDHFTTWHLTTG